MPRMPAIIAADRFAADRDQLPGLDLAREEPMRDAIRLLVQRGIGPDPTAVLNATASGVASTCSSKRRASGSRG